jgi:6-phosphofructokinase
MKGSDVSPVVEGDVLFVASGGRCPGKQRILEEIYARIGAVSAKNNMPIRLWTARGGMSLIHEGDSSCLTLVTEANLKVRSPADAPICSFGTSGPSGLKEEWVPIVHLLLSRGIRYFIQWGGDYSTASTLGLIEAIEDVVASGGKRLYFVCMLKSVDNDVSGLKDWHQTIGFSSAVATMAKNLRRLFFDAQDSESYVQIRFVQGNQVGHLCSESSRLAGVPMYLIPEFFKGRAPVTRDFLRDIILGSWLKGAISTPARYHSLIPVAEGMINVLDEGDWPGLKEARAAAAAKSSVATEGASAKDFEFDRQLYNAVASAFDGLNLSNKRKIKVRMTPADNIARGSNTNEIDQGLAKMHSGVAVDAVLNGGSGLMVVGTGLRAEALKITDVLPGGLEDIEPRPVNVEDRGVQQHWSQFSSYRLMPQDLVGDSLSRMAKVIGCSDEKFVERFQAVADWGDQYS